MKHFIKSSRPCALVATIVLLANFCWVSLLIAQPQIRLPQTTTNFQGAANAPALTPIPPTGGTQAAPAFSPPPSGQFGAGANGNAVLGAPQFDPFSSNPQVNAPPQLFQAPPNGAPATGFQTPQLQQAPAFGQPLVGQPGQGQPQFGPAPGFPQSPPVGYPGGASQQGWGPAGAFANPTPGPYLRLFQNFRLINTFLYGGNNGRDLEMHELELATTLNYPNFLYTGQPLQVSPGFIIHWLRGPVTDAAAGRTADLPPRVYSAYVDFAAISDTTKLIGAEGNFRVGVYSDFSTLTVDSVRFTGTGLGWYRVSPSVILKGGVKYLDRNDVKILPAFGVFWTPNPDVNLELYFPKPKLSQRFTTLGNTDVWGYIGGEYGGGSWTVQRLGGASDQVDINDLRVYIGAETKGENALLHGFAEIGYVFDRELIYKRNPQDNLKLRDTFMLRGGAIY